MAKVMCRNRPCGVAIALLIAVIFRGSIFFELEVRVYFHEMVYVITFRFTIDLVLDWQPWGSS